MKLVVVVIQAALVSIRVIKRRKMKMKRKRKRVLRRRNKNLKISMMSSLHKNLSKNSRYHHIKRTKPKIREKRTLDPLEMLTKRLTTMARSLKNQTRSRRMRRTRRMRRMKPMRPMRKKKMTVKKVLKIPRKPPRPMTKDLKLRTKMTMMVTMMKRKSKMILIMKMKSMKKITKVKQNGRHVVLMNLGVSHLIAVLKKMKKKQNRLKMRIKSTLTLNNQNKMTKRKILKK